MNVSTSTVHVILFILFYIILLNHVNSFVPNPSFIKSCKITKNTKCSSLDSSTDTTIDEVNIETKIKFESEPFEVYIEDTDAYGVMYNANYVRCYERALHLSTADERKNHQWDEHYKSNSILNNPDWFVLSITNQKFRGSPLLGSKFVIVGELEDEDNYDLTPDNNLEIWSVKLICAESQTVYNEAVVTIAESIAFNEMHTLVFKKPPIFVQEPKQLLHETTLVPYRDEFDRHVGPTHIPLRNVLNLFERSRTILLGGPNVLQKLKEDDGIMYVVSSISNLSLINLYHSIDDDSSDVTIPSKDEEISNLIQCQAGKDVVVKNIINIKRNGMIVEFYHTLLVPLTWKDTESGIVTTRRRRLAQGVVTIVAIDKDSRRPTSKLPSYLLESFHSLASSTNE